MGNLHEGRKVGTRANHVVIAFRIEFHYGMLLLEIVQSQLQFFVQDQHQTSTYAKGESYSEKHTLHAYPTWEG